MASLSALLFLIATKLITLATADIGNFDTWDHVRVELGNVSIHARYAGTGPPILLVHGYPEHSLTWSEVGPILAAQNYTVIAPDLRGMGDSGLAQNSADAYDSVSHGTDLAGLLEFLTINTTFVFGHDKGTGATAALVAKYRDRGFTFPRIGLSEYPLPGYGYETFQDPPPTWNLYNDWQLDFFSIPDAAQYFIQGRERQMLSWYFFHDSYSGTSAISSDRLTQYTDSISKPGFLRSGLSMFSMPNVASDAAFFKATLGKTPFQMPVLGLGGEASIAPKSLIRQVFAPIAKDLTVDVVPKAGHWIADENPEWLAARLLEFFAPSRHEVPSVDLSYLTNKVTFNTKPLYKRDRRSL